MVNSLRPSKFTTFVGQKKIKDTLKILIQSSQMQKKQLDHILFHGPPGLGKTTLATIVANELGSNIRYAQGAMLDKKADILSLFGSISKGDVIFIDEIHGINKNIEELIYSAIEDNIIDIAIGADGDSRIVRMKLPPFTLIGATTKITKISKPLRERFGYSAKLKEYDDAEIEKVVKQSSKNINLPLEPELCKLVGQYSQNVPRVANNLLMRIKDFSIVKSDQKINKRFVLKVFGSIGIYRKGLNELQIVYLKILNDIFYEKWVSQENVSSILKEPKGTIDLEVEPVLIKYGFIEKSSRGRRITTEGIKYITTYNLV